MRKKYLNSHLAQEMYEKKTYFCTKILNYTNLAEAVTDLGVYKFKEMFKKWNGK